MLTNSADYACGTHTDETTAMRDATATMCQMILKLVGGDGEETMVRDSENALSAIRHELPISFTDAWLVDHLQQAAIDLHCLMRDAK